MEELLEMLRVCVASASHGDKLPTVRSLMHTYGVSQKTVQHCLEALGREGLISAHVGRGTFVVKDGGVLYADKQRPASSVLILTRNVGSARTRRVLSRLQNGLSAQGIEAVQVTYSEVVGALPLLRSLPRFDLCIVQCHFEPIPIDLLSLIKHKAKAILFDGATVSGLDVDSVGSDWRLGLEAAIRELAQQGHRRIGMIGSAWDSHPIEALRRHYASLQQMAPWGVDLQPPIWLDGLPSEGDLHSVEAELRAMLDKGGLDFTALIVWGALEGSELRQVFTRLNVSVPEDLSVMVLGHRGVATESDAFFTVAGSDLDETVNMLLAAALSRLENMRRPSRHGFLGAGLSSGLSVRQLNTIL